MAPVSSSGSTVCAGSPSVVRATVHAMSGDASDDEPLPPLEELTVEQQQEQQQRLSKTVASQQLKGSQSYYCAPT